MTAPQTSGNGAKIPAGMPDTKLSVRETFGIDTDMEVPAFS